MVFDPGLKIGKTLDNGGLCSIFGCGTQGGMRRAIRTNSLVIISNHIDSIYDDRWVDGVLHYTGMGRKGDQSLTFMQNRTLTESDVNDVNIFLFEVYRNKQYTFSGKVKLAALPFKETQPDEDGNIRVVWVFPLGVLDGVTATPNKTIIEAIYKQKERQANKLTNEELRLRAEHSHGQPGRRQALSTQYDRSPWVATYSKHRANGKCDLCSQSAPFIGANGQPHLENHHIVWLAEGGADTIMNTVALCPNCHRKMHFLNIAKDREYLIALNNRRAI